MSDQTVPISDQATAIPDAAERPRKTIVGSLLGWATGIAAMVVMVLVVIELVRSPPSALH